MLHAFVGLSFHIVVVIAADLQDCLAPCIREPVGVWRVQRFVGVLDCWANAGEAVSKAVMMHSVLLNSDLSSLQQSAHTMIADAHRQSIDVIAWHPAGHLLATTSHDCILKFWCREAPGSKLEQLASEAVQENPPVYAYGPIPVGTPSIIPVKANPNAVAGERASAVGGLSQFQQGGGGGGQRPPYNSDRQQHNSHYQNGGAAHQGGGGNRPFTGRFNSAASAHQQGSIGQKRFRDNV